MDAVFLNLVNISITASYIAAAVIIFRFFLKKAPKAYTCILWLLAALRLIIPVSDSTLLSFTSRFSLIPSTQILPGSLIDNASPQFNINVGIEQIDQRVNAFLSNRYYEGVKVPANNGSSFMNTLGIIWIIVCAAIIIYAIGSYIYFRRKTRASICVKGNTFICDYISTPFILGIIKPKILLPSTLGEEESRYVLAHEKAHLKRLDHLWKPTGFILLAIHWFNPIMWISYILFCRDIELACDEYVIKNMNSTDKKAYSTALLNCSIPKKHISAYPLAFGEIGVKERIKAVIEYKKPAVITSIIAVILCIVTAICFLSNPQKVSLKEMIGTEITNTIYGIETDDRKAKAFTGNQDYIDYILNQLDDTLIGKIPYKSANLNTDYKTITILYPKPSDLSYEQSNNSIAEAKFLKFSFNTECSEVWIDDGEKSTAVYKVSNPEKASAIFEYIEKNENIEKEYYKKYVYMDSWNETMAPHIVLFEKENSFEFFISSLSSYIPRGSYEIEEDRLILRTDDGKNVYTFRIEEHGVTFDSAYSSVIPKYYYSYKNETREAAIPNGAFFELINA